MRRRKGGEQASLRTIGPEVSGTELFGTARSLSALGYASIDAAADLSTIGWTDQAQDLVRSTEVFSNVIAQLLAEAVKRDPDITPLVHDFLNELPG
jgi:hypothetical protein